MAAEIVDDDKLDNSAFCSDVSRENSCRTWQAGRSGIAAPDTYCIARMPQMRFSLCLYNSRMVSILLITISSFSAMDVTMN